MPTPSENSHVRIVTIDQLLDHIREAREGGEFLMKEVWERCSGESEYQIAEAELDVVIGFLEHRREELARTIAQS